MIPDDIRKLLGGYATGTLTGEERTLLFSAALEDQELFDALADEEALRELLADPNTRQKLIEKLEQQPVLGQPLQPWREANDYATMPLAGAAPSQSLHPSPVAVQRASAPSNFFATRRFAVAGSVVVLLLVAIGVRYASREKNEPTVAMVRTEPPGTAEVAPSVPSQPVPKQEPSSKQIPQPAAPRAAEPLGDSRAPAGREGDTRSASPANIVQDTAEAKKKSEKYNPASEQGQIAPAIISPAPQPAAAPPPAAPPGESQPERAKAAQASAENRALPPPPAPPAVRQADNSAKENAVSLDAGLTRRAEAPKDAQTRFRASSAAIAISKAAALNAKVTDLNGTIVSIDAGSNSGLKVGDTVEIVRNNQVIATTKLTQVGTTFAAGPYQPAAVNPATPRSGDLVRRAQ